MTTAKLLSDDHVYGYAPPLCPVHAELERRKELTVKVGNDCMACSLHERVELLEILAAATPNAEQMDSVTALRNLVAQLQQVTEERDRVRRIADKRTEVLVQARQHFAQSHFAALVNGGDGCVKRSVADYVKTLVDHATQLESQLAACERERDRLSALVYIPPILPDDTERTYQDQCESLLRRMYGPESPIEQFRSQLVEAVKDIANDYDKAVWSGGDAEWIAGKRDAATYVAEFIKQFQVKE